MSFFNLYIFILSFFLQGGNGDLRSSAQLIEIAGNWRLKEGWFPDQNLEFEYSSKENDNMVFCFRENGKVEYLNKNYGDCPVGAFSMKEGSWTRSGDQIILELRGLKISDYWYWWKVRYKVVSLAPGNLRLEVVDVIKKKEIKPTATWEDLIKE